MAAGWRPTLEQVGWAVGAVLWELGEAWLLSWSREELPGRNWQQIQGR